MTKFFKNWIIILIVLVVIDVIWHKVILGGFYNANFVGVARLIDGELSPLIQYIILGDILVSFGYTYLVTALSAINKRYLVNGIVVGLVVTGSYSLYNFALIPNWQSAMVLVDILNGIVFGAIMGTLLKYLNRGKGQKLI